MDIELHSPIRRVPVFAVFSCHLLSENKSKKFDITSADLQWLLENGNSRSIRCACYRLPLLLLHVEDI